eukprot:Hpha_TRINITY_DN33506_c0_g1::TRINITY_DN33506_c0_g1_i1::g.171192::m.171192
MQRAHSALALSEGAEGDPGRAAAHAVVALAGMDATLPRNWPGKAEAAARVLRFRKLAGDRPAEEGVCPEWLSECYSSEALRGYAQGQRRICEGEEGLEEWTEHNL